MAKKLLCDKPYKVTKNSTKADGSLSLRVQLSPECNLRVGSKVYQVLRDNGVIELIPENVFTGT